MQRQASTLQRIAIIAFPLLALSFVGCARPSSETATEPSTRDPETIARRLVAEVLSLTPDQVVLISVESQDFSDSSLGCPSPGMSYLQVITPGHRVLVEADGRRFDVRVAGEHGKICHPRKPGGKRELPTDPPTVSEAVASCEPCATAARSAYAIFFVSVA